MNGDENSQPWKLGSDLPLEDPADDDFGYAPFASRLATAIIETRSPKGLVLAVHGKWGSGKSSLLNFIKFYLEKLPKECQPIVVEFNPWWFEGRDNITTQLLAEFSSQLPDNLKFAREIAKLIGRYSKEIEVVAGTYTGNVWFGKFFGWAAKYISNSKALAKPEGVPKVKNEVAKALKKFGKRFVFFIDDIDRLTPDEASDLFRSIKALADFPEVVYVLFFDREEVAKALTTSLKMDGEAYLEKIIQAPFNLPAVDRQLLGKKLLTGLDSIIEAHPMPFALDRGRWAEVYLGGLDRLIRKPRDIVRVLNSISIVYPAVAGEVNPVDFIAIEFLRVFEPVVYGRIREAKEYFTGDPTTIDYKKSEEKSYFEAWKASLPDDTREGLSELVGRIFPKVNRVLTNNSFLWNDSGEWRKELRPCSSDNFDVYFQFGLPPGHVSRAELDRLIGQKSSEGITSLLLEARNVVSPDGHSKARDFIERLSDFDQLSPAQATNIVKALVDTGHILLRKEDERGGFFSIPNRWRLSGLICRQLERLSVSEREVLLMSLAESSPGLWSLVDLADSALRSKQNPSRTPKALLDLSEGFAESLSKRIGYRLDHAILDEYLAMPDLDFIVYRWNMWGDSGRIREVFSPMLADDDDLMDLLDKFVHTGTLQSGTKLSETYHLSMKPLAAAMDVQTMAPRVSALAERGNLTPRQQATIKWFEQGLKAMADGKDPDNMNFIDGDK